MKILHRLLEFEKIEKYSYYLTNKLFPALEEWGLKMYNNPIRQNISQLTYVGLLDDGSKCTLEFSTSSTLMDDTIDKMFCTVNVGLRKRKAGGLTCKDVDYDFEVIARAIEEAGYVPQGERE